jgi:hypothetical protein
LAEQALTHAAATDALKAAHAAALRTQANEFKAALDQAFQEFSSENARLQACLRDSSLAPGHRTTAEVANLNTAGRPGVAAAMVNAWRAVL